MLWLLPMFIRTVLYLFGCPIGGVMSFFSTAFYAVFLVCVIPAYFIYAGPEAAIRFSLLLCIHSLVLMMIPKVLRMLIPLVEVALLIVLLFLPINITPPIAVWFYEKMIYVSSPILSVFEAVHIVLLIMESSQMVVDRIDEQPNLAKSVILGAAGGSFGVGTFIAYYLYNVYNSHSINRIIEAVIVVCVILLVLSLIKEEGIISDVPCLYFVMMCVVWALAKESTVARKQITPPSMWLRNIPKQLSFLDVLASMVNNGLASFQQLQTVFFHLISPCLLVMAGVRILSLGYILRRVRQKFQERSRDSDVDDGDDDDDNNNISENQDNSNNNVFFSRVVVIFVFTELLLRTVFPATSYHSPSSIAFTTPFYSLNEFQEWWSHTEMVKSFFDFRIWRIIQLCLLVIVYFYKLMVKTDDDDD